MRIMQVPFMPWFAWLSTHIVTTAARSTGNDTNHSFQCEPDGNQHWHLCRGYNDSGTCPSHAPVCITRVDQTTQQFFGSACCDPSKYPFLGELIEPDWSVNIVCIFEDAVLKGKEPYCRGLACRHPLLARSIRPKGEAICCNAEEQLAGLTLKEEPCCGDPLPPAGDLDNACCIHDVGQICGVLGTSWLVWWHSPCCLQHPGFPHCEPVCRSVTWPLVLVVAVLATSPRFCYKYWFVEEDPDAQLLATLVPAVVFVSLVMLFLVTEPPFQAIGLAVAGLALICLGAALIKLAIAVMAKCERQTEQPQIEHLQGERQSSRLKIAIFISQEAYSDPGRRVDKDMQELARQFRQRGWQCAEVVYTDLTHGHILDTVEDIRLRVQGHDGPVTVFFYISAHGVTCSYGDMAHIVLPGSWLGRGLPMSEVRRRVMTVTSGHLDLIVVVNSCRVPATGIARVLSLLSQMPRIVFQRGAGTRDATSYIKRACLISACPPDEEAIEGLLTKAFVNLLSRTQGPIKWQQLLAQDLQNEVRRAGGMQAAPTPEILVWGAMPEDESDESGHLLQLPGGWA